MRPWRLPVIVVVGLALGIAGVAAQEDGDGASETPPETIVVTAEAPAGIAGPAPGIIVIEIDEVRGAGDTTLGDLLSRVPGVQLQRTGSGFESSTVRIRGSTGEQVLVLRDGRPVADGRSSSVDLSRISLAGIERVELVLGPATALYGAGGAAGAVNLITRPTESADPGIHGTGRAVWGSFGEYRGSGTTTFGGVTDRATYTADVAVDGVLSENTYRFERLGEVEERRNAGGRQGSVDLALRRENAALQLEADGSISAFRRGLPGTVEFPSASAELAEERGGVRLGATLTAIPFPTAFTVGLSRSDRGFRDDDYPLGALATDSSLTAADAELAVTFPLGAVTIRLPVSGRAEVLDDTELGETNRGILAIAPSVRSSIPLAAGSEIGVDLSGRGEVVSGGGEAPEILPSWRGSLGWTAARVPIWTGVAAAGGYRLPDFSELFLEGSAFAVGNPDLEPEESISAEWEFRLGDRYVQPEHGTSTSLVSTGFRTAVFVTEYRELIQWLPDPTGYWRPRNTGEAQMYGLEADVGADLPLGMTPWSVDGSTGVDILQARDRNEGVSFDKQLPYRPQLSFRGAVGLEHLLGHRVDASVLGRGARPITRQNTVWLDPYIDLTVGATITVIPEQARVSAEARNLLDETYVETRFYPNPGREFRIAVEVEW
ncbi:MAG: TonB-dependent receptor [Spirochaeta sp.]|jgi:vitamin B12 transporter|nr:TonB-dependent receptor [Spirochaeta sp.]